MFQSWVFQRAGVGGNLYFGWWEPAVNTDGNFMACLMLVYLNKKNKFQQQHNFFLYSMCCNIETEVALCPGSLRVSVVPRLFQPCLWNLCMKKSTLAKKRERKNSRGNMECSTHTFSLSVSVRLSLFKGENRSTLCLVTMRTKWEPHLGGNGVWSWRRNRCEVYLTCFITTQRLRGHQSKACFSTFRELCWTFQLDPWQLLFILTKFPLMRYLFPPTEGWNTPQS